MNDKIIIDRRFCGPPDSGNGGYVCGRMAAFINGAAAITLHRPPPLERPLKVRHETAESVLLQDGRRIIAEAHPTRIHMEIPAPPAYREAEKAAAGYIGFKRHPFPTCFVCGPERTANDGLRIFPGTVTGSDRVAAPWRPDTTLADDETGNVKPEFLWSALDCPGGIAAMGNRFKPMLLGRLAARIHSTITPGEPCLTMGWPISNSGRKYVAGSALFSRTGRLCACALATWIEIRIPG